MTTPNTIDGCGYEEERRRIIERNQQRLRDLGIDTLSKQAVAPIGTNMCSLLPPSGPKRMKRVQEPINTAVVEADEQPAPKKLNVPYVRGPPTRYESGRKPLRLLNTHFIAPFSLLSIGVTVHELGSIYRGPWAQRFWSSKGCLYHHAYPVGYRATKVQFGRVYECTIEAGPHGPIFKLGRSGCPLECCEPRCYRNQRKVTDTATGSIFTGESPTKPWTDVCLSHNTGQRISGPLFFGFSDLTTLRAIAQMYTPEEMEAALQGERPPNMNPTREERAAEAFIQGLGMGESSAMALALTTQLGGERHPSLPTLQTWARQAEANAMQLYQFLTTSEEMPAAIRRWPRWRRNMVPPIMAAVVGPEWVMPQEPTPARAGPSKPRPRPILADADPATTAAHIHPDPSGTAQPHSAPPTPRPGPPGPSAGPLKENDGSAANRGEPESAPRAGERVRRPNALLLATYVVHAKLPCATDAAHAGKARPPPHGGVAPSRAPVAGGTGVGGSAASVGRGGASEAATTTKPRSAGMAKQRPSSTGTPGGSAPLQGTSGSRGAAPGSTGPLAPNVPQQAKKSGSRAAAPGAASSVPGWTAAAAPGAAVDGPKGGLAEVPGQRAGARKRRANALFGDDFVM